ncbi:uncharacterized protein LOC144559976 [Carex rostrata]
MLVKNRPSWIGIGEFLGKFLRADPLSKSKKEAEQNASRFGINSLLENSDTSCLMSQVIKKFVPATAESDPNPNPNLNCNVVSQIDSVKEPVEVTETNPPVFPQYLIANNTFKSILKEDGDKNRKSGCAGV